MKKTHKAVTGDGSALKNYQDVIVGDRSLLHLLYFELCVLLSPLPGAAGMLLRKVFWPRLFRRCGKGVVFGTNIVLRHPGKIELGDRVVISDGAVLDGRNEEDVTSIHLDDEVMMSNDVMLSCKNGSITIGKNSGINAQAIIQSTNYCPVKIGDDVIIGQRVLIVGGGNYNTDNVDVPMREQGIKNDGGVVIESDVWLGGNASILGGVTVGRGSIIAASCVMTKTVPPFSLCRGIPGKIHGSRKKQ